MLGILAFDLLNYAVHRLMHSVELLWRVHEIHHSDRDFDVSTSARFHPIEVLITQAAKLLAVRLLAPSPLCVLVVLLLSSAQNLFAHANGSLPPQFETWLRLFVITPDAHRLHHSSELSAQNKNFGQLFPWWDRLLGTWGSVNEETELETGVRGIPDGETLKLGYMLLRPFQRRS